MNDLFVDPGVGWNGYLPYGPAPGVNEEENMEYFLYSKKQSKVDPLRRNNTCEIMVKGKWERYTEWNTSGKSNFDDAKIIHQTKTVKAKALRINGVIQGI